MFLVTKGINHVDIAGAELLAAQASVRRAMGGNLYLHRLKDSASDVLERGGYMDRIGRENMYDPKETALPGIFEKPDSNTCSGCDKRIFLECASVPINGSKTLKPGARKA